MNKNFKIREQDYKAMQGMNEKQAGQFIKGLCGYAFEGKPFETKDAKLGAGYFGAKSRERQKRRRYHGGASARKEIRKTAECYNDG